MKWILLALLLWGAWLLWKHGRKPKQTALAAREQRDAADARTLLGVSARADAEEIRAAHRRLLATEHPDRGGSADVAGRANAARDLLLRLQG